MHVNYAAVNDGYWHIVAVQLPLKHIAAFCHNPASDNG